MLLLYAYGYPNSLAEALIYIIGYGMIPFYMFYHKFFIEDIKPGLLRLYLDKKISYKRYDSLYKFYCKEMKYIQAIPFIISIIYTIWKFS